MGDIFRTRFSEAKCIIQDKIKKMTGSGLGFKRKPKPKNSQSQVKRRKVKDIFTDGKKEKK